MNQGHSKTHCVAAAAVVTTAGDRSVSGAKRILGNGPLFGRLPKCGRKYLMERGGWEERVIDARPFHRDQSPTLTGENESDRPTLLHFTWPNKSGPQPEDMQSIYPSLVRPYPTQLTNIFDDKLLLSEMLKNTSIVPETLSSADPLLETVDDEKDQQYQLYFVKHRLGAQGKSVYALDRSELLEWFRTCKNQEDFIIQKEVPPVLQQLDEAGPRKVVLRCHMLIFQRGDGWSGPFHPQTVTSCLHNKIICLPHATPYDPMSKTKSSHISQAGKNHPKPYLLDDMDVTTFVTHSGRIPSLSDVRQLCAKVIENIPSDALPSPSQDVTCFGLLGLDLLLDSSDDEQLLKLCEINSHPALGWGSMKHVDYGIYKELIEDMLAILVFEDDISSTSFVSIT